MKNPVAIWSEKGRAVTGEQKKRGSAVESKKQKTENVKPGCTMVRKRLYNVAGAV